MFIQGQKVVCINDTFPPNIHEFYDNLPSKGSTYVVRGIAPGLSWSRVEGEIAVYLVGLINPVSAKAPHRERGFNAERFRPLTELTEEEIRQLVESTHIVTAA